MTTEEVLLEIPGYIKTGIDTGVFTRNGSVVRNQAGVIVTHLKEITKKPSKTTAVIFAGLAVTAASLAIHGIIQKRRQRSLIRDFNSAFSGYLVELSQKELKEESVDHLLKIIEEIRNISEDIDMLADNNGIISYIGSQTEADEPDSADNNTEKLHYYLTVQKLQMAS